MERQVFHRALGLSLVGGLSTAIGTVPPPPGSSVADFPPACRRGGGALRLLGLVEL